MAKEPYIETVDCIACESCIEVCPAAFKLADSGDHAEVIPTHGMAECIQEAIDICPVACISWVEE